MRQYHELPRPSGHGDEDAPGPASDSSRRGGGGGIDSRVFVGTEDFSRGLRAPIPAGGVTGAPGHAAAREIVRDFKRGEPRRA